MKILIVHQYYLQRGEPGGSRFNEFARLWTAAGHQVTLVAGTINYTTGAVAQRYRGRWTTKELDGAVTVWRCFVPRSYRAGYLGRMWAFLGWTFSAATAVVRTGPADIVIATSPPLVAPIPGWLAARSKRAKLIFEVRDLWPESAVTTGVLSKDGLLTRILYKLERWACGVADLVNVLTPAFRDDLVRRGLAVADKICFVPNGADLEIFSPGPRDNEVRREMGWGDRFVVMYAGAHGRANAVRQLLDAADLLRSRPDILLATVGDGPERLALEAEAVSRGLSNVMFCGPQPKSRMPDFVNACDVGAAVLADNPTFRTVYPNKVFDYMACSRPTLLAIDGVARELVCDQAGAGVFARPEQPRDLADAILRLAADGVERAQMGQRGRAWVEANASRDSLAQRYLSIMEGLVSPQRKP